MSIGGFRLILPRWILHPARWTPRRRVHFELTVDSITPLLIEDRRCPQDHINHPILLCIMGHIHVEVIELKVPVYIVKVVGFDAEIARVDMNSTQGVS